MSERQKDGNNGAIDQDGDEKSTETKKAPNHTHHKNQRVNSSHKTSRTPAKNGKTNKTNDNGQDINSSSSKVNGNERNQTPTSEIDDFKQRNPNSHDDHHHKSQILSRTGSRENDPDNKNSIPSPPVSFSPLETSATKLSTLPGKSGSNKPLKISVKVPSSVPFESGVNTECIQLLRQLWNAHDEAVQFLGQIRSSLSTCRQELRAQDNHFENSLKEKRNSTASVSGLVKNEEGLDEWIPFQAFIHGLKCISESFSEIEKQVLTLSQFQTQCKLALFAKVKHAKLQVSQDRLSILHGIQQLITISVTLISSPTFWPHTDEENNIKLLQKVLQLTEVYNWVLESSWSTETGAANSLANSLNNLNSLPRPKDLIASNSSNKRPSSTSSVQVFVQINAANRNDSALLRLSLKPFNGTRLLQLMAQKRSTYASHSFSKTLLSYFYSNSSMALTPEKFESCFGDEDVGLNGISKAFSQHPSLMGRAAVKKTDNGDQRLSKSTRTKMYSHFHQVLWTLAGEQAEDLFLWGPTANVPLVLQTLDTFKSLRNMLLTCDHRFQESNMSSLSSAFDSVSGALHSFSLLANWDEKMREAFDETYLVKRPEHIALVNKPEPSQWATEIGAKFGHIVTSCLSMVDHHVHGSSNLPNITSHRSIVNEEEHLGNEAHIFFRLEASLVHFKAWVVKRSKVWLNSWAIPQFLAVSQREPALLVRLIKSRESILTTRDFLLNHEDISIRLSAKHRKSCADDLRAALLQVQRMPEELLLTVGPVCQTLSLATLQSYMPPSNHWKGVSGITPDKPSPYVSIFIGRVIEPVIIASVELVPGPVQEAMGKQVVNAACDAWLQYILHKKIRFSEWGAVQLLRDFTAFREWIRTETELEENARKAILQLEILKTCEGVAYLLLRNPGDVLGVGKASRKNRRVAPSTTSDSLESTPGVGAGGENSADDDIPAEMYVPNQKMWLELRLRRATFTPPCC